MKVGIIGTRGIPNEYGGFEQFAMFFAEFLAQQGVEVTVYNSSNHPYKEKEWRGVKIEHAYDPENKVGTVGQFVYDLTSILNARKKEFDVIFQLGYTSSSVWGFLFPKSARIITNMDGLEWKRSKYNKWVQLFLKQAERWAVKQSDELIADSIGIQTYLKQKYKVDSTFVPYGAELFETPDEEVLTEFELKPFTYNLVVARLEPENNVEVIIKGHLEQGSQCLCVVGNYSTSYGTYLQEKYGDKVRFLGRVYDQTKLNNLRYYAQLYFHGHSVGGTNPSLLEALACNCLVIAHDNIFNQAVLGEHAYYFNNEVDVKDVLLNKISASEIKRIKEGNKTKIKTTYSFEAVHNQLMHIIENTPQHIVER